ncbi:hypothetical protein DBR25_05625 [Chryseobacterium sp. HMWF001]|nr:hypothetical protein DBR25_05625 [Chryseobacterium sp. HMWF001]
MIRHICIEAGLGFEPFSDEWILQISSRHHKKYIFGYSFPLNPDTASKICNDKSATAELLFKNDIPVIATICSICIRIISVKRETGSECWICLKNTGTKS